MRACDPARNSRGCARERGRSTEPRTGTGVAVVHRMRLLAASVAVLGLAGVAFADIVRTDDSPESAPVVEEHAVPIIGGTSAPAGKWPDTVAVLGPQSACSGTLIAPDVVLTAGHCYGTMTTVIAN